MALAAGVTVAARRLKLAIFAARSDNCAGDHLLRSAVRVRLRQVAAESSSMVASQQSKGTSLSTVLKLPAITVLHEPLLPTPTKIANTAAQIRQSLTSQDLSKQQSLTMVELAGPGT